MTSFMASCCRKICPCLFNSSNISKYHKKLGETEHQSFVAEVIEIPQNNLEYQEDNQKGTQRQIRNIYAETPDINQLQQKNKTSMKAQKTQKKTQSKSQEPDRSLQFFKDCIKDNHPFYQLFSYKFKELPGIFDLDIQPQGKVPQTPYNLKVYVKTSQDEKINIFVYTFVFPTNYECYENLLNNFQLQKSFDVNIDQYECVDKIDESTRIIYLAYKKILFIQPRDFQYVRYNFTKQGQHWSIATSHPNDTPQPGKTRGDIILTATKAIQKDNQLYVSVYSQVDMKMAVKATGTKLRGVSQIKKYLDKCYDYVKNQKNSII